MAGIRFCRMCVQFLVDDAEINGTRDYTLFFMFVDFHLILLNAGAKNDVISLG